MQSQRSLALTVAVLLLLVAAPLPAPQPLTPPASALSGLLAPAPGRQPGILLLTYEGLRSDRLSRSGNRRSER